jgi:hypothetical protein
MIGMKNLHVKTDAVNAASLRAAEAEDCSSHTRRACVEPSFVEIAAKVTPMQETVYCQRHFQLHVSTLSQEFSVIK